MKVKFFLSFLQSEINYSIPAYDFWQYYIKNGIEEAGHSWEECPGADWAFGRVPKSEVVHLQWKQDIWDKTIKFLKKHPADVFLSYLYPDQIDDSAIKEIQKMGIPCVNFFCDNIRDFKNIPLGFNVFDLNWIPEYKAIQLYKKAGFPYINLPMPMWVNPEYRVFKGETNHQITFIGSKEIQRLLLFERLVSLNPALPLAVYGNGWNEDVILPPLAQTSNYNLSKKIKFNLNIIQDHGFVPYFRKIKQRPINTRISDALNKKTNAPPLFKEYNRLIAESMITLGVNRYPSFRYPLSKPDTYSRLRDIEAPMLGACYLTEWTEGIENLYDIGNEIELYKTPEDLIEKVAELQTDKEKRKKLKINGQKKALQQLSISESIAQIIKRLK